MRRVDHGVDSQMTQRSHTSEDEKPTLAHSGFECTEESGNIHRDVGHAAPIRVSSGLSRRLSQRPCEATLSGVGSDTNAEPQRVFGETACGASHGPIAPAREPYEKRTISATEAGDTARQSALTGRTCLIVDDCALHRESLATVFTTHGHFRPAAAWDEMSFSQAIQTSNPEIVLVNVETRHGLALLRSVRGACPDAKVIVVGVSEDDESEIIACAEAGVTGYHLRADSMEDLFNLISGVARGESLCSPKISMILVKRLWSLAAQRQPETKELALTAREIQILRLLELGHSNNDIARELCIALHTVKNHVHSVLSKLGVRTRAEAGALSRSMRSGEIGTRELGPSLA
jgi:DNA-binding NarL/FixJ family response regulator